MAVCGGKRTFFGHVGLRSALFPLDLDGWHARAHTEQRSRGRTKMTSIWSRTAFQIAQAVREKEFSATEVTQAHLDRHNDVNPSINAIVQHFPEEALAAAQSIDAMIARGEDPGILCGVPVTTKVNTDQKGHATTNGVRTQEKLIAPDDSPVVSNLRKAGSVIVGRTNTPSFSLRWFTNNRLHGQTLNPRNKAITPGGSSGGASAAVAAGLCAIGHGTDIAGSIRYPAYACGLHGLRPTMGRIPTFNPSGGDRFIGAQVMAVSGPIARRIDDLTLSLIAMSAPDPRDPWYVPAPLGGAELPARVAYTLEPDGLAVADAVAAAILDAVEKLRAAGWLVEEVECPPMRQGAEINACLWMAETKFAAGQLMQKEEDDEALFVFEQMSKDAGEVSLERVMNALKSRATLVRAWEAFAQEYPVFLCPVSGELPFDQQLDVSGEEKFKSVLEAQMTQRALPAVGMPCLSVATGAIDGKPIGVQLVGPRFREDILLQAGRDLEAASPSVGVSTPDW